MTRLRWPNAAAVAAFAAFFVLGGCGGGDNPLASARKMVKEHPGPNAPINSANVDSASAAFADVMGSSFERAFTSTLTSVFGHKPARAEQGGTITITLEESVHPGLNSGSVTVKGGKLIVSSGDTGAVNLSMNTSLEYDDYSDDGIVFIGGTVDFSVDATLSSTGENIETLNGTFTANLATTGKYNGTLTIDFTVTQDAAGTGTITGTVTTDGRTMTVNLTEANLFGD